MADERIGMTRAQQLWTFVPLALVSVLAVVVGIKVFHPKAVVSVQSVNLYMSPQNVTGNCDAAPSVLVVPAPTAGDASVTLTPIGAGTYTMNFVGTSPFRESPPYQSPNSYTIPMGASGGYFPYTISVSGVASGCHSAPYDIGIIVGH